MAASLRTLGTHRDLRSGRRGQAGHQWQDGGLEHTCHSVGWSLHQSWQPSATHLAVPGAVHQQVGALQVAVHNGARGAVVQVEHTSGRGDELAGRGTGEHAMLFKVAITVPASGPLCR